MDYRYYLIYRHDREALYSSDQYINSPEIRGCYIEYEMTNATLMQDSTQYLIKM